MKQHVRLRMLSVANFLINMLIVVAILYAWDGILWLSHLIYEHLEWEVIKRVAGIACICCTIITTICYLWFLGKAKEDVISLVELQEHD